MKTTKRKKKETNDSRGQDIKSSDKTYRAYRYERIKMTPTKELSMETIKRIGSFKMATHCEVLEKTFVARSQHSLKVGTNMEEIGPLKKENVWHTMKNIKTTG